MADLEIGFPEKSDIAQRYDVGRFLSKFGLGFDSSVDFTVTLRKREEGDYGNGEIVATGSFAGEVLRNIAIDETYRGEGLTATVLNALVQEQARRGIMHAIIFTKPAAAPRFSGLGFREIARAEPWAVLLESGLGSIDEYLENINGKAAGLPPRRGAIVVNCNPFTLGHLGLVEYAAAREDGLIVFVVQEDKSLFPFADRFELVKKGLSHLKNVVVVPTGIYMVSSATFPTYFTREEHLVEAQTRLDISLFAKRIAPALGIARRYVGEEPYCAVTDAYNRAMSELLPESGIGFEMIRRITSGSIVVSASTVRELIRKDDWDGVRSLVPDVTWEYLRSPDRAALIGKIKGSDTRH